MARDEGKALAVTAAAILRMNAHTLSSQADLLQEMADRLVEQADRVEHGGELPNLRVVEDAPEKLAELPRIEGEQHAWTLAGGGDLPGPVVDFIGSLHVVYTSSRHFVALWNDVAAGNPASVQTGLRLTEAVREMGQ